MNIQNASEKIAPKIEALLIITTEKWRTAIRDIVTSWLGCTQSGSPQLLPLWLVSLSKLTHWHLPIFMLSYQQCQMI